MSILQRCDVSEQTLMRLCIFPLLIYTVVQFIESSVPSEITKLRKLRDFRINDNFILSTLPDGLGDMNDIEFFDVSGNSMFGQIPDSLYNMTKLKMLRLDTTLMAEDPWIVTSEEGFTGSISTRIGEVREGAFKLWYMA